MPASPKKLFEKFKEHLCEDLLKKTAEAIFMSKCLKFNGFFGKAQQLEADQKMMASKIACDHIMMARVTDSLIRDIPNV